MTKNYYNNAVFILLILAEAKKKHFKKYGII